MGFSDHPLTQSWRSRQRSNLLAACCAWHEVADAVSAIVGRGRKRTISYCTHLQRTRRWRPRVHWHDGERSEEPRVGKECVRTVRFRWCSSHSQKNNLLIYTQM